MGDTADPAAEAALERLAEIDERAAVGRARIAKFSEILTGSNARQVGQSIAFDMLMQVLSGDLEPRGPKEALEVAEKAIRLTTDVEWAAIGDDIAELSPGERKELFAKFKADVASRQKKDAS